MTVLSAFAIGHSDVSFFLHFEQVNLSFMLCSPLMNSSAGLFVARRPASTLNLSLSGRLLSASFRCLAFAASFFFDHLTTLNSKPG